MASSTSRQNVNVEVDEITEKWNSTIKTLETRKETLNKLADDWNVS